MASESELFDETGNGAADDAPASGGGPSSQAIGFALASAALAVAGVLLAIQFFAAEHVPALTDAALQRADECWKKNGPASYDMDLELRGAQPGLVHVEVRKAVVMAETRDGREPGRWTWDTWSVPGMFDTLTQDIQIATNPEHEIQAADGTKWRLQCEFDPQFGYPKQYHRLVTGGPEVYWRVINFQPK